MKTIAIIVRNHCGILRMVQTKLGILYRSTEPAISTMQLWYGDGLIFPKSARSDDRYLLILCMLLSVRHNYVKACNVSIHINHVEIRCFSIKKNPWSLFSSLQCYLFLAEIRVVCWHWYIACCIDSQSTNNACVINHTLGK